jgi:AcrR family transcriptional regulator
MIDEKRPYRKQRRAELETETRRRITESAVELHRTVGPARTSIKAVAEHAGVRRSTVYRHFRDEASLFEACTAHWTALNQPPDLTVWDGIDDPDLRLRRGLEELYAYYGRTERMMENLHRDEAAVPTVERLFGRFRDYLQAARRTLLSGRRSRGRARARAAAAVGHAVSFPTWQSLAREQGMQDAQAADLMCRLVTAAER